MQQEHRTILTTLYCSFGSWASAQVTAPCGADNPRPGSHLTRRGVPPSVVALAAPSRAPAAPTLGPERTPLSSGADAARISPAGATSSHPRRVVPWECRRPPAASPHRRTRPRKRAATPAQSVDDSQPVASGAGLGTGAMSWQVTTRIARGRGRGEGTAKSGERWSRRGTRAAPTRYRPAQRDEFHRRDVGAPRFGAVFLPRRAGAHLATPESDAPTRHHASKVNRRNVTVRHLRAAVPSSHGQTSRPPSGVLHVNTRRHVHAW
jgi:hypothetical protein